MKVLKKITPTSDQLIIVQDTREGPFVIRGAAGSGKTTTALYRLKTTVAFWRRRREDGYIAGPIRVLVVTYNKTLAGFVQALAEDEVDGHDIDMQIVHFDKWAMNKLGQRVMLDEGVREGKLQELGAGLRLTDSFLVDEVSYVLGRFAADDIEAYIGCERRGRGASPQMDAPRRRRLLDEVIYPYLRWKADNNLLDWSDLPLLVAQLDMPGYHVVVIDEAQDFSANQVRALLAHLEAEHSITFVLDGAQRIYPQRFLWTDVGLNIGPSNSRHLPRNFRNTIEIAQFAGPLLATVETTDDSSIPNFTSCTDHGPKPTLVAGKFHAQMDWVLDYIDSLPADDDIAIIHALGGGWFSTVRARLNAYGLSYVDIAGRSSWPTGPVRIGLSTMHSVKGLEFDHAIVVGLNQQTMPHGAETGDSTRDAHLRLLAMAAGRARKSLVVTYKPAEASDLIAHMDPATYELVKV